MYSTSAANEGIRHFLERLNLLSKEGSLANAVIDVDAL
jgi:hypothetical protein